MTIQDAISKAVEGGWKKESVVEPMDTQRANFAKAMIDPLFWQALGKSMGWEDKPNERKAFWKVQQEGNVKTEMSEWKNQWHNFIDHLAEGKSIEEYFANL